MFTVDEGFKSFAYKDTKGKTTVGIGFNMDDPKAKGAWIMADIPESYYAVYSKQQQLSQQSAWSLLGYCINGAKKDLLTMFDSLEIYPQYVQFALINLIFNMGKPVFSEFNTFIGLIKAKDFEGAANDLAKTKWATELPNRAMRVCALLKGDDSLYSQG